jgi:pimeloyl-ACP methyl ester carboxylesterase
VRARFPDWTGSVDRAGVEIHFEVFNRSASPTVLLVAPSPITHSRIWKALIPHLARRCRVVTFDGRGNGRSGRPTAIEDHTRAANVGDIVAVLDATDTGAAVVVAHCHANWWIVDLLSTHPERVEAFVAISPGVPYLGTSQPHWASSWNRIAI